MARVDLTDARVGALKPRNTARDVREGKLRGFGVRVLPSGGKRFFIHRQHRGERVWKIVRDAAETTVVEARSRAMRMLAAIRRDGNAPRDPSETLFQSFAGTVFRRHERVWNSAASPQVADTSRSCRAPHKPSPSSRPSVLIPKFAQL